MPRTVVGLLAAVGSAIYALVAFVHCGLTGVLIVAAASATGLAAYLTLPSSKKMQLALKKVRH